MSELTQSSASSQLVRGTPTPTDLANAFSRVIREWATAEELATIVHRNGHEQSPGVCHSHDFFDANEAMMDAFATFSLSSPDGDDAEACALWGRAWDIAKANHFIDTTSRCLCCERTGPVGKGCPTCPGFWYTHTLPCDKCGEDIGIDDFCGDDRPDGTSDVLCPDCYVPSGPNG